MTMKERQELYPELMGIRKRPRIERLSSLVSRARANAFHRWIDEMLAKHGNGWRADDATQSERTRYNQLVREELGRFGQ